MTPRRDMNEPAPREVTLSALWFVFGLAVAGFFCALTIADMKTERDEARAAARACL